MADIKNNKLSAVPSPVPSSKSPLPPLDSEGNPVVDPDADMEDDPDVITKVCLNFSTKCLLTRNMKWKITILQHSKSYYSFIPHTIHPVKTKLENFKYYTSLVLGTLCIVSIFAFLFLVPFVLDPAISTLMHEFVDKPVTCRVMYQIFSNSKNYNFQ